MTGPLNKDTLIRIYWILHAVQRGEAVNIEHAGACFVAVRDALLQPDSEQIVDHIREQLQRQQAAADALADQAIGQVRRQPLDDERLSQLLALLGARHRVTSARARALAIEFGRLVEAAHGIRP